MNILLVKKKAMRAPLIDRTEDGGRYGLIGESKVDLAVERTLHQSLVWLWKLARMLRI